MSMVCNARSRHATAMPLSRCYPMARRCMLRASVPIPLSRGVIGRDFDAEHLAIDVVREFFTMPDQRKRVAAATHQTVNGFRTPAARKATKKFVSDAATIDRDDTTQIVRLFDEGLPALKEVGEVFTTPAFDRLIAPKPPSVKVGLSIKGNLVEISPLADECRDRVVPCYLRTVGVNDSIS